jgi:hypothetical protein
VKGLHLLLLVLLVLLVVVVRGGRIGRRRLFGGQRWGGRVGDGDTGAKKQRA